MKSSGTCPNCKREFTRKNQRHACGTGTRAEVLRNRPETLIALYCAFEEFAKSLGPIELVARDRYTLFRSQRIFADAVIMTDAIRLAIHLGRRIDDTIFFKIVEDRRHVTHVAKLRDAENLALMKPYLQEAHDFSLS